MSEMQVWMNGAVVDLADAKVSVLDHGLLYGDGVFEGIRIRHGRVFRLDDHLHRLEASCAAIGLTLPGGQARAREACLAAARALDKDEAYLRLVVTRGVGPLGIDPTTCSSPSLFCVAGQIVLFDAAKREKGLDLVTSFWRRPASDVLDPRVKSLNYLNNVLAKREAKLRHADDALLLNAQGRVVESAGANLFIVRRGALQTPPASEGALEGVTRRSILELARALHSELGLRVEEVALARADVLDADEVFLTGSGAGVARVASLDGVALRDRDPQRATEPRVSERLLAALVDLARTASTPFRHDL
jgi:branched-chain amino acid aminotransferase